MMISDYLFRLWLMDGCTFNQHNVAMSNSFVNILPANPTRLTLILSSTANGNQGFAFGDSAPTLAQGSFVQAAGQQALVLSFDELGQLIRLPLWGQQGGTPNNITVTEITANPARWALAMRVINEQLSKYNSP